ncbi:MAG: 23S rRNA (uracil(1939)-C(5))-methyltransferase RlmD [Lachnospiraceae bacterium]|nr:23S rRNA (uracil(1939)-C(5))-methyltransferase RlmD [Lachnospiraceae bacterium]
MRIEKNDILTVEIISLGSDGEGIAKADGFPVFIKDSIPGDICEIKIIKAKKNLAFGRLLRIIKASPDRVKAPCPVAKRCGGCSIQPLSYDRQLDFKKDRVRECLSRIGGIDRETVFAITEDTVGMDEPYRYRNKAQYPVGYDRKGDLTAGFFASRSHEIISNDDCLLLPDEFADILDALLRFMKENGISAYDEKTCSGSIRHLVLRKAFATGEIMAVIVSASDQILHEDMLPEVLGRAGNVTTVVLNINKENTNIILGNKNRILSGSGYITDILCGLKFRISPLSFYQVNPYIASKLYETVLEYADLSGSETVWDVCCGIGTIALFLAGHCKKVLGIEIVDAAVKDAEENALLNGVSNADFITGAAEDVLPRMTMSGSEKPDAVILDPPRSGMERPALDAVIKVSPERIVYVSCDPATLARDVKILLEAGYSIRKARPFDQFCQSGHVEVVSLLQKMSNTRERTITLDVEMEDYYRLKNETGKA